MELLDVDRHVNNVLCNLIAVERFWSSRTKDDTYDLLAETIVTFKGVVREACAYTSKAPKVLQEAKLLKSVSFCNSWLSVVSEVAEAAMQKVW